MTLFRREITAMDDKMAPVTVASSPLYLTHITLSDGVAKLSIDLSMVEEIRLALKDAATTARRNIDPS